jgi:hypothetical protein
VILLKEIDWQTALAAVKRWHYSGGCTTVMSKYGAWEDDRFIGCVLFSAGAASCIAKPFGLQSNEVRELVRVALDRHETPTSKIVAIALRMFRKDHPECKVVVSYADTAQGHVGTIYQAGGWLYLGSKSYHAYRVNGILTHPKTLHTRYGIGGQSVPWLRANVDPQAERVRTPAKHKYCWIFDRELKEEWRGRALPYPHA